MNNPLDQLRGLRTPVVYDAIERFGLRPRQDGYTDASIRCLLPSLGAFVGYAATGRIRAALPRAPDEPVVEWDDVWRYVEGCRGPSIMVSQDLDEPAGRGCAWGDVSASIFLRLGCVAVITNGAARDIREVEALGFGLFAGGPVVGHANIRFVEINGPVAVGGLMVHPGDLIHADEHGAVVVPSEIDLGDLVRVAREFMASERSVIDYARAAADFSIDGVKARMEAHDARDYRV